MIPTVSLIPRHQNLLPRPFFHKARTPIYYSRSRTLNRQYAHQNRHDFKSEISYAAPAIQPYQYDLIPVSVFNRHPPFTSADVRSIALDSSHPLAPWCHSHCTFTLPSPLTSRSRSPNSVSCSVCGSIRALTMAWQHHPPSSHSPTGHSACFEGLLPHPVRRSRSNQCSRFTQWHTNCRQTVYVRTAHSFPVKQWTPKAWLVPRPRKGKPAHIALWYSSRP